MPLPIGRPGPGVQLSLEQGQIVISGAAVGPGYVNLPEKQAAVFPRPGSYRSGDMGACDPTGLWHS